MEMKERMKERKKEIFVHDTSLLFPLLFEFPDLPIGGDVLARFLNSIDTL
jgi:hypothetical protein